MVFLEIQTVVPRWRCTAECFLKCKLDAYKDGMSKKMSIQSSLHCRLTNKDY